MDNYIASTTIHCRQPYPYLKSLNYNHSLLRNTHEDYWSLQGWCFAIRGLQLVT